MDRRLLILIFDLEDGGAAGTRLAGEGEVGGRRRGAAGGFRWRSRLGWRVACDSGRSRVQEIAMILQQACGGCHGGVWDSAADEWSWCLHFMREAANPRVPL